MSEDRTKKDPLLGGLDGMRAGQHWEGEPESLRHWEKPDQAQEAFSAEKVQSAEEEARKIAQELHREAVRTGNTEKEQAQPIPHRLRPSDLFLSHMDFSAVLLHSIIPFGRAPL